VNITYNASAATASRIKESYNYVKDYCMLSSADQEAKTATTKMNEKIRDLERVQRNKYLEHLCILLDSIGGDSDKFVGELLTETAICNRCTEIGIDFKKMPMIMSETAILSEISKKNVFNVANNSRRPTVYDAPDDLKVRAFLFLQDIHDIRKLRVFLTSHPYIACIGACLCTSLLNVLWNWESPSRQVKDLEDLQVLSLIDKTAAERMHIFKFPSKKDPIKIINSLHQQYHFSASFYVLVIDINDNDDVSKTNKLLDAIDPHEDRPCNDIQCGSRRSSSAFSCETTVSTTDIIKLSRRDIDEHKAPFVIIITGFNSTNICSKTEIEKMANILRIKDRSRIYVYAPADNNNNKESVNELRRFLRNEIKSPYSELEDHQIIDACLDYQYADKHPNVI
jgi:hypothetical protein